MLWGQATSPLGDAVAGWDIAKSDEAELTSGGRVIGRAWEPANTTTTWGLRLGAKY